jgi:hypothetical protein
MGCRFEGLPEEAVIFCPDDGGLSELDEELEDELPSLVLEESSSDDDDELDEDESDELDASS